jgi:cellulose biosynthesis protein BcsQ
MRHVIVVANAKGGVGKTSMTAGLAGFAARAGYRVLTVDADPQGNLSHDLGYPVSDGQGLALAIQNGMPIEPIRNVRPNLDCVPGGSALFDVPGAYVVRMARGQPMAGLRAALDNVRPEEPGTDYDLVLVDTPPGEPVLQELVFRASDLLIIPTRSDEASLDGLVMVAHRFAASRHHNPDLRLLGVVLFGVRNRSERLREGVRASLEEALEGAAPVFRSAIRYHESAAVDMRREGLLPYELVERHAKEKSARLARLHNGQRAGANGMLSRDAVGLSEDYAALAEEILAAVAGDGSADGATPVDGVAAVNGTAPDAAAGIDGAAVDATAPARPKPGKLSRVESR